MNKILIKSEDKKLVNELFWNSFLLEASYNYERQQALGFCVGMWPAIKRFYKTKDEQAKALVRHMAIYNTTPHVSSAIAGVAAAMEKEASLNQDFDINTINSVKVGFLLGNYQNNCSWYWYKLSSTGKPDCTFGILVVI